MGEEFKASTKNEQLIERTLVCNGKADVARVCEDAQLRGSLCSRTAVRLFPFGNKVNVDAYSVNSRGLHAIALALTVCSDSHIVFASTPRS